MNDIEDDGEIEYLDEDADIVTQCVQANDLVPKPEPEIIKEETFLTERYKKPKRKPKRKKEEDSDYEYDPSEDLEVMRTSKKRKPTPKLNPSRNRATSRSMVLKVEKPKYFDKFDSIDRKKIKIRIPDYEDPLCLPVRALKRDEWDIKKLKNWNNLCLEHFKQFDAPLRAEKQQTVTSKRTVVLRNVRNKSLGKVETTMYSKICVENQNGDKKSEVVQSVLPRYQEKNILEYINWSDDIKSHRQIKQKDEVLLTKENVKDVETLVAYKTHEKMSLIYRMYTEKSANIDDGNEIKHLQEIGSCKTCAPCYQTSWRGFRKTNRKNIMCHICSRPCLSVYNLLAHLKSHSDKEVKSKKHAISKALATVVEYHYKCRICGDLFGSIRMLRDHVNIHKGQQMFKCEVGNHLTK